MTEIPPAHTPTPTAVLREQKRLGKEPFLTMVPPREQGAIDALRGWKPPITAYILFEKWEIKLIGEYEKELGHNIMILNAESRPEILQKVRYYVDKGYRVIHYGNFPKISDKNKERAKLARIHSQGGEAEPWEDLAKALEGFMNGDTRLAAEIEQRVMEGVSAQIAEKDAEIDALRKKVAEQEAKNKKAGKEPLL